MIAHQQARLREEANQRRWEAELHLKSLRQTQIELTQAVNSASAAREEAERAADRERLTARKLRSVAYGAEISLAQHAWESNQLERVEDILRRQVPQSGESDLRGFEWHLQSALMTKRFSEFSHSNWNGKFALNGSGTRIAVTTVNGVYEWGIERSPEAPRPKQGHAEQSHPIRLSDLHGDVDSEIATDNAASDNGLRRTPLLYAVARDIAYLPDETSLAVAGLSRVTLWNVDHSQTPVGEGFSASADVEQVGVADNGVLVAATTQHILLPVDAIRRQSHHSASRAGTSLMQLAGTPSTDHSTPDPCSAVAISGDGRKSVAGYRSGRLVVMSVMAGRVLGTHALPGAPAQIRMDRLGQRILVVTTGGDVHALDALDVRSGTVSRPRVPESGGWH